MKIYITKLKVLKGIIQYQSMMLAVTSCTIFFAILNKKYKNEFVNAKNIYGEEIKVGDIEW